MPSWSRSPATTSCTPLATVYGFARTLERVELEPPADRYVEMIGAASSQIDDLVDQLRLATRIQLGVYKPVLVETDSLELAQAAAERLEEGRVEVSGEGSAVLVDPDPTARALAQLARAAARFGGHDTVTMQVAGPVLTISPLSRPRGAGRARRGAAGARRPRRGHARCARSRGPSRRATRPCDPLATVQASGS